MSDVDDIRRVLARWMQLDDGYRDDEWVDDILDDDFSFSVGDRSFVGKAAIRDLNRQRRQGPPRGTHILSEPVIDVGSDRTATAVTDYIYVTMAANGYEVSAAGQYRDMLVRDTAGRWRVTSRTNTHLSARAAEPSE